ncbi:Uncharacterized protein FWK35_00001670 [Aphis craccivora]|uniref:Uncharacterized protein n=1 Tax=Aphis craccivora TaxID=307492 RepID=A0A6G0ZQM4_APHCR|nr:Uncharacterized protein FWK35_00001670 [Aphis craccivora]
MCSVRIMCVNVVVFVVVIFFYIIIIIIIIVIIIRTGRQRRWIGRACARVCREVWTTGALLLRSSAPRSLGTVSVCRQSRATATAAAARPTDDLRAWPASIQMVLVRRSATAAALPRDEIQNILGRRRRPSCLHRRRFFHILSAVVVHYNICVSGAPSPPRPPLRHRHPPTPPPRNSL